MAKLPRVMRLTNCFGLTLSAISLVLIGLVPTGAAARESTCPELIKPQSPLSPGKAKSSSTGYFIAVDNEGGPIDEATLAMDFGTSRNRDVRTQTYELTDGLDPDTVRVSTVNDIVRGNDPLPIANGQLTYRAYTNRSTGLVNVRVCYDPGGAREPEAGRYFGALLISAPGAKATPLALELTFRDDQTWKAIAALLVGVLIGVFIQAIALFQQAPPVRRPKKIWPYVFNLRSLVVLGTGLAVAFTTYGQVVDGDPTWSASISELGKLAGAAIAATLAAKTAADLKGPTEKEKTKGLAAQ